MTGRVGVSLVFSVYPHSVMTVLISALAFILLVTLLIIIHELGHFAAAKFFGVEVEEFGFGLPPRAKTLFRSGTTLFTLNWVPFGGFVRLKGENEVDVQKRHEKGSFGSASFAARILILCGGVTMNFLLAFLLLTVGFSVGHWVPYHYSSQEQLDEAVRMGELTIERGVFVQEVTAGGPAARSGIQKNSAILAVNKVPVSVPEDVVRLQKRTSHVQYSVMETTGTTPRTLDIALIDGKAGIALVETRIQAHRRSLGRALILSVRETGFMTMQTVYGVASLVRSLTTRFHVPEGIAGIVGMYGLTRASVQEGFMMYLRLVAFLSLSLATLNILPLPPLDGGRLLFVLVEMVIQRPLNQRFEILTNAIGFCVLIGLILIITLNDVIHLF